MSEAVIEAGRNDSDDLEGMAPAAKQQTGDAELSMQELDDASGGLLIPILFAAGFYYGYRHPLW